MIHRNVLIVVGFYVAISSTECRSKPGNKNGNTDRFSIFRSKPGNKNRKPDRFSILGQNSEIKIEKKRSLFYF
jgi:hypothetical protein